MPPPPLQVRTQKKTDVIVSTTAHLLQERSYESISIQDIAKLSECSVTSIYARFIDKEAILPAVNLIIMEYYRRALLTAFSAPIGSDIQSVCNQYIDFNFLFYKENANFIKAAAIIKSDFIFQQMNALFKDTAGIVSAAFFEATGLSPDKTLSYVEFGVQQVHTNFRDRIMCGDLEDFDRLSLARLLCAIIHEKIQ